jgi:septum formation protein
MIWNQFSKHKIILASQSPRRQQLLGGLELEFEIRTKDTDESYSSALQREEVALYLAEKKADAFIPELKENEILITADTTVYINGEILNKPMDRDEAIKMLTKLSGQTHTVITGVCLANIKKKVVFHGETEVSFTKLEKWEIEHYVDHYSPFDKAGSYGAQDFIGYIGIEKMNGSYYNVMGLPLHLVYQHLESFL